MVQIIASDMDGTMLNDEMVISKFNADAVKHAQAKGVHFIVSSGRAYREIKPLIEAAGFNCPMITMNGALVLDENGNVLSSAPLSDQLAKKIILNLKKKGLYFEVICSKGVCSDDKAKRIENFAELLASISPETPYKLAVALASARMELMNINYVDDYFDLTDDPKVDIFKIVAFSQQGPEVLNPIREELLKNPSIVVTSSGPGNIEINHINAQKGIALQAYADRLNVPLDNVMAIGDNNNDVSMLKVAGISYAMGNGTQEVKKIAKYIADLNTADGVGKAIEEQLAKGNF
ncbi:Cof-type HAD-IIB family hydrolase [Ligilactobacillus sp. Marseille-Q7487]|jgi:Cof subfamily protein (haloacid dehalogenase superfamily)|uniref:Cof-type HAD-IIB family hydrolase n=1 Tax=Ligilactobacillus sp. Marseille-Q7487 TaxID=3022128 RepID=UPI0015B6BACB|nr:Cof-type HAD-IIB family hydrolase [Ligilactobacillus sp. Marseille-Q7487]